MLRFGGKLILDNYQGCLIGYCDKVCPTGVYTNDNRQVTFRGNKGPAGTGSNGNAGPIDQSTGIAVDPAAVSYLKQIERYQKWAEQQVENAKSQLETV